MSRVISFSRVFPAYHPKSGHPTNFVEAIYKNQYLMKVIPKELEETFNRDAFKNGFSKGHTIRSGSRWKVGDKFSPRVWSGKPYHSKMITIADDIQIRRIYNFEITGRDIKVNGWTISPDQLCDIAENDGLHKDDLLEWFKYPNTFCGQIICWDDSINY